MVFPSLCSCSCYSSGEGAVSQRDLGVVLSPSTPWVPHLNSGWADLGPGASLCSPPVPGSASIKAVMVEILASLSATVGGMNSLGAVAGFWSPQTPPLGDSVASHHPCPQESSLCLENGVSGKASKTRGHSD